MPPINNHKQMCFYPRCLWMSTDATLGAGLHSHTHSFSLSVSPLPCLSLFPLKRCCDTLMIIIEIQDSIVFGCSHFIGSNNTKIDLNKFTRLKKLGLIEPKKNGQHFVHFKSKIMTHFEAIK